MKKTLTFLFIILSFSFFGCDLILNNMPETPLDNIIKYSIDFEVFGFGEDCSVLKWSTSTSGARFKIYEKKSNGNTVVIEENYTKSTYLAENSGDSSYAIGLMLNNTEVYKTNFIKPDWNEGFPVWAMISDDNKLGITFPFIDNVDYYALEGEKENGYYYFTDQYDESELEDILISLKYDENSNNNWFALIFTIGDNDYISEKYYFDYDDHLEALDTDDYVELFPTLEVGSVNEDTDIENQETSFNFIVQAFNEDSVVLQWSTDLLKKIR